MTTRPWRSPAADSCAAAESSADWERPWAPGVDCFHAARPGPGLPGLFGKEMQGAGVGGLHGQLSRCRRWPTEACLRELARWLPAERIAVLQLWRPRVDPWTFAYQRELLAELRL